MPKYANVTRKGRANPKAHAAKNSGFQWFSLSRSVATRIAKPSTNPKTIPAPFDCSNKHVRAAKRPVAKSGSRLGKCRNNTAEYSVRHAQNVLSQLCRTRNLFGRPTSVTNAEDINALQREQTRRAIRYVRTDRSAPSTTSTARPTRIELPKILKKNA